MIKKTACALQLLHQFFSQLWGGGDQSTYVAHKLRTCLTLIYKLPKWVTDAFLVPVEVYNQALADLGDNIRDYEEVVRRIEVGRGLEVW